MYKCYVCNKSTYNLKTCMPSERLIPVCEGCYDKAPLDIPDGFSNFCAKRIFKGEDNMNTVLSRYKQVKDNIMSFFNITEKEIISNINAEVSSLTMENAKINNYYEPMYHMSELPPIEAQKGEIDPMIYKVYKSPINSSYWCASGYNKQTMTFSGMVLGIDVNGYSFDLEELYSYMVVEYNGLELPMRLSNIEEKLGHWK